MKYKFQRLLTTANNGWSFASMQFENFIEEGDQDTDYDERVSSD